MSWRHFFASIVLGAFTAGALGACESAIDPGPNANVHVERAAVVTGVADWDRDPAIVLLDLGNGDLCSATLVAPDVVLTARRCVAHTSPVTSCPTGGGPGAPDVGELLPAAALAVRTGAGAVDQPIVARGSAIVTTTGDSLCGTDIAFVVLDTSLVGIAPLALGAVGEAKGSAVRTVGFGDLQTPDGGALVEVGRTVRDHLPVVDTGAFELVVTEASCGAVPGGPALDDATGAVVGVRARSAASCGMAGATGDADVYTRVDVFGDLFTRALAADGDAALRDAGHHPLDTDLGGACQRAADCAAGICLSAGSARYCSRPCSSGDKCTTGYICQVADDGRDYCVAS